MATAVAARSAEAILPLHLLGGVGRSAWITPKLIAVDSIAAAKTANTKAAHMPRPPVTSLFLPIIAVGVFSLLLASANPVIESAFLALQLDAPLQFIGNCFRPAVGLDKLRLSVRSGSAVAHPAWHHTRCLRVISDLETTTPSWHRLFFKPITVAFTLLLLNLLFAAENTLDIWHVWMKAELPLGMTHADYVHRGSYTLIATAVLAGLLMVFAMWKGTATEQSKTVRRLIYLWTLQNLVLVASSAKRTFDYIDAYGWSEWRLAGLLWMGLVFFGLASIIWRVAKNHDSRWLMNTNLVAATLLLLFCAVVDMRSFIARQNLASVSGQGPGRIDFAYIESLGPQCNWASLI